MPNICSKRKVEADMMQYTDSSGSSCPQVKKLKKTPHAARKENQKIGNICTHIILSHNMDVILSKYLDCCGYYIHLSAGVVFFDFFMKSTCKRKDTAKRKGKRKDTVNKKKGTSKRKGTLKKAPTKEKAPAASKKKKSAPRTEATPEAFDRRKDFIKVSS